MTRFRRNVTSLQFGGTAPNSFVWTINPTIDAYIEGQISLDPGRDLSLGGDPSWPKGYMNPGGFPYFAKLSNGDNVVDHTQTVNYGGRLYCATSDPVDGYIGPEVNGIRAFAGSYDQGYYGYTGSFNTEDDPAGWGGPDAQDNIAEDPENPGSYILISGQPSKHPLGFFPQLTVSNWRYNIWETDHYELLEGDAVDAYYLKYEFDADDPTDKSAYILYLCHYSSYEEGYPYPYEETSMKICTVRAIYRSSLYTDEQENFDVLWDAIFNIPPEPPVPVPDDPDETPYETGDKDANGDSGQTGGTDVGDTPTDFGVTFYRPPTIDGTGVGFFSVYRVSQSGLDGIAQRLWNPTFWDSIKSMYREPGEAIVAIYSLPFKSREYDGTHEEPYHWYNNASSSEQIALGGTTLTGDGGKGLRVIQRYVTLKMGTARINSRWDNYPNYNKYTKVKINLPFCGEYDLDINELLQQYENKTYNKTGGATLTRVELKNGEGNTGNDINLEYVVDTYTGACVAKVKVGEVVKYQFSGQMQCALPWSYASRESGLNIIAGLALGGAAVMTGAGVPALAAGALALGIGKVAKTASNIIGSFKQGHANGSFGSLLGAMQSAYPYITITYPSINVADEQDHYIGRAKVIVSSVGTKTGFVSGRDIHLEGVTATDEEKNEIERLLREGVVIA